MKLATKEGDPMAATRFSVPQIRRKYLKRLSPEAVVAAHSAGCLDRILLVDKYRGAAVPAFKPVPVIICDGSTGELERFENFADRKAALAFKNEVDRAFAAKHHRDTEPNTSVQLPGSSRRTDSAPKRRTKTARAPRGRRVASRATARSRSSGDDRDPEPPPQRGCLECGLPLDSDNPRARRHPKCGNAARQRGQRRRNGVEPRPPKVVDEQTPILVVARPHLPRRFEVDPLLGISRELNGRRWLGSVIYREVILDERTVKA